MVTVCGDPLALSTIEMFADLAPEAVGVNVAVIVHVADTAKVEVQVVLRAKSPELVPVTVILVILRVAVPVFCSVTSWPAEVVPRI